MRRRDFITVLGGALTGALAMPRSPAAQARPDMLRVGTVSVSPRLRSIMQFFEQRMRELGYIEGQNYTFDYVDLQGRADRFDEGTQELVRRNADIIIAFGPEAPLKAAVAATRAIPIVMIAIDFDPFARGYVTSLARPSGNITGLFFEQIELAAKRLQLLKDAFPGKHAATVFWDQWSADQWEVTKATAPKLGWQLAGVEVTEVPYDYERALAKAPPDHREVLIPMTSPLFARDRERLAQFALRRRMVSMFVFREYVELGGLMSYGPSRTVMTRRAADYVNRIARGAKPADLPIERPNTFETVINLKTAKALGLEFSQAMLLRADEVIE